MIGKKLQWRELGRVSWKVGRALGMDSQRAGWNFLIILPKIYRAVLKDAPFGCLGHVDIDNFKIMARGVQGRTTLIART